MSRTEARILKMLVANGGEMYGLQMVKQSGGALKRGAIYVTLQRMEEKGFVGSREERNDVDSLPRRYYKPTGLGARVLDAREQVARFMLEAAQGVS